MPNIVPKLNLNKTPNLVENNSLVFAKNIRLDVDGTIHRDYGVSSICNSDNNIFDKIYLDCKLPILLTTNDEWSKRYKELYNSDNKKIVGYIEAPSEFFLLLVDGDNYSLIVRYDETTNKFDKVECNWNWSGGSIIGKLITNLKHEKILIIAEKPDDETILVPLKSINITKSKLDDNESTYTQASEIPLFNLNYKKDFNYSVPNGTYQFYIRYKIRDNFYTNWYPASKPIFIGNKMSVSSPMGHFNYTNIHKDSDTSVVFNVEKLNTDNDLSKVYSKFQVGFILSHDDSTYARAWKEFDMSVSEISFDYKAQDAEALEIEDMTKLTFNLYNVGNLALFKNKAYISNYKETDFNATVLESVANDITIDIDKIEDYYVLNKYRGTLTNKQSKLVNGKSFFVKGDFINDIVIDNNTKTITNIFKDLVDNNNSIVSFKNIITESLLNNDINFDNNADKFGYHNITSNYDLFYYTLAYQNIEFCKYNKKQELLHYHKNATFPNTDDTDKIKTITLYQDAYAIIDFTNNEWVNTEVMAGTPIGVPIETAYNNIINNVFDKSSWYISHGDTKAYDNETSNNVVKSYTGGTVWCTPNWDTDRLLSYSDYSNEENNLTGIYNTAIIIKIDRYLNINYEENGKTNTELITYPQYIILKDFGTTGYTTSTRKNINISNTTLIPGQYYNFYIHFISKNGEITNGFLCNNKGNPDIGQPIETIRTNHYDTYYPKFNNINCPSNYIGYFFSIIHIKNYTYELVNTKGDPSTNDIIENMVSLDLQIGNLTQYDNLAIIHKTHESNIGYAKAEYYDSNKIISNEEAVLESDIPSTLKYFGNYGIVKIHNNKNVLLFKAILGKTFINSSYNASNELQNLIKCTPYIPNTVTEFVDYSNMNLLGYIVKLDNLSYNFGCFKYTDGSTLYRKWYNDKANVWHDNNLGYLQELSTEIPENAELPDILTDITDDGWAPYIYCNINANYKNIVQDFNITPFTWYKTSAPSSTTTTDTREKYTKFIKILPSLLFSSYCTKIPMYHSYFNHYFYPATTTTTTTTTTFENTIRSSTPIGDEDSIDILHFDADDYYNTPTDKGKITNLASIADMIIVHTEHTMFKFNGSSSLQSSTGDVAQAETQPFDTGISEIFGSAYGLAGLKDRKHSIVTDLGYIFFDKDSNIIYLYAGQGQLVKLSDSIEKLFRHDKIVDVRFANDFYNNRIFTNITFDYKTNNGHDDTHKINLSFNFSDNVKSFVSLHDFNFDNAINTKTKCYFSLNNLNQLYKVDKSKCATYDIGNDIDILYPLVKKEIKEGSVINKATSKVYDSIIDIIVNSNYENVKTLNAVNWCGNFINSEFKHNNTEIQNLAEDNIRTDVPCKAMMIYTDSSRTPKLEFTHSSTGEGVVLSDAYKHPRWNQGFWTFNYFRNIAQQNNNPYISDENSLIEGKYFVVRFYFDKEFKLETLKLNYNTKIYE